jgi:hypothetical protein
MPEVADTRQEEHRHEEESAGDLENLHLPSFK